MQLPLEQEVSPHPQTVIYLPSIDVLTAGEPGTWNLESLEALKAYRAPFATYSNGTTQCPVVIACPDTSDVELYSQSFVSVWAEFIRTNKIFVELNIWSTSGARETVSSLRDRSHVYRKYLGNPNDVSLTGIDVWFFTKEFFELDPMKYWSAILGELRLYVATPSADDNNPERTQSMIEQFSVHPETCVGQYDNFWLRSSVTYNRNHLTIVRRQDTDNTLQARSFRLENRMQSVLRRSRANGRT